MIITQRNTLGREPFIGQEWHELPETIMEAANTGVQACLEGPGQSPLRI